MAERNKHDFTRDFSVRTKVYPNGRANEVSSVVPLHSKVKEYLAGRSDIRWFHIYDGPYPMRGSSLGYGAPDLKGRKVYYVCYSNLSEDQMTLGPSSVMVFDQTTGELLYDGTDGGD